MNRFLPSKKLLVFLGVVLVILGCFVVFFKFKDRKVSYFLNIKDQKEITKMVSEISQQTLKNDSDGDGLKDWEEILWKTDPKNPDTDGDGTNDNLEILAHRNPLIPGPDDFLSENLTVTTDTQNNSEYGKPLTQTDILSRELFVGYVTLKQNNQIGTVQEEEFINNLVIKNLSSNTSSTKKYTLDDLNIIDDDSKEILQQYGEQLKEISELGDKLEHDVVIAKRAIETRDQQELEKLNTNADIYREMQKKLFIIKVPAVLSSIHLDITNALNNLINNISNMLLIFDDPIIGLRSIQNYFDNGIILANKVGEIIIFYNQNNIKF